LTNGNYLLSEAGVDVDEVEDEADEPFSEEPDSAEAGLPSVEDFSSECEPERPPEGER
jgi:hypothetical protein